MKRRNYIVNRNPDWWPPRFAVVVGGVTIAENLPSFWEAYKLLCRTTGYRYKDALVDREPQ